MQWTKRTNADVFIFFACRSCRMIVVSAHELFYLLFFHGISLITSTTRNTQMPLWIVMTGGVDGKELISVYIYMSMGFPRCSCDGSGYHRHEWWYQRIMIHECPHVRAGVTVDTGLGDNVIKALSITRRDATRRNVFSTVVLRRDRHRFCNAVSGWPKIIVEWMYWIRS